MIQSKRRVLVTGINGNYGGTEAVVSRFMEALSDQYNFDTFCYHQPKQKIFSRGDNRVFKALERRRHPLRYYMEYHAFFHDHASEYDAIWYNGNQFSNIEPLKLAYRYGIPNRIIHYHSTAVHGDGITKLLTDINRREVLRITTSRLACSDEAGQFAYGEAEYDVIYNAFDLSEFNYSEEMRRSVREELGLGDAFVIGNVGRLSPPKNQVWLVRLMRDILKRRSDAMLVIVGDGDIRDEVEHEIRECSLEDRVILTGARADIARILCAFDVFAFPSLWEGLGVSAVEAQVSGLPCIMSEHVPSLAIVSGSAKFISLNCVEDWVDALCAESRKAFVHDDVALSRFDIDSESKRLAAILDLVH